MSKDDLSPGMYIEDFLDARGLRPGIKAPTGTPGSASPDSFAPAETCVHPGCHEPVSSAKPRSADLAPYCSKHRRALSRRQATSGPRLIPDRESAQKLFENLSGFLPAFVDITPELAFALLERNTKNRKIAPERVTMYARDMSAGAWHPNNQGIALGAEGIVYDGQHRLAAIVEARKTVRLLVISGLPEGARATIDQGRRRSVGDNLQILDGQGEGKRIASWLRGIDAILSKRRRPLSMRVVRAELERFKASIEWVIRTNARGTLERSPITAAFILTHHVVGSGVEPLFDKYISGAELDKGEPMLTLRDAVMNRATYAKETSRGWSLRALRCIQASLRGEKLEKLVTTPDACEYFVALLQAMSAPSSV